VRGTDCGRADRTEAVAGLMLRNFAYASVSAGSAALLLVLFIIAGRVLGDTEFGKFSFALALGTIFETLMDFGLHQATVRAVARDKSRATEFLEHTFGIKLVWTSVALTALVATATLLRHEWDVRFACYMVGGALVMRSYMLTIRGVLQGLERFGWDSLVVLADRGLLLVIGTGALLAGTGLRGLAIAFVVARGLALAVSAWLTRRQLGRIGIRYDPTIWRQLQTTALPLGFFLVVLNLYSYVDGVMLGVMRTDVETGLYTAAYRVYEGLTYAPSAIAAVLTPRLSGLFLSDRLAHRRLSALGLAGSIALAILVAAVGYVVATPLMVLLFGSQFAAAARPFRVLCSGLVFVFAIWVMHAITISVNRERLLVKTAIVGLVVNVGLNLYVIPRMGTTGAALATVLGELVSLSVLTIGLWRARSA
jgi:O-antigen/teichoic acid export membrane protein